MELKDLFKTKTRMIEEEYQENDKIEKFIFDKLKSLHEYFFGEDEISRHWRVEVLENEFLIYYDFGQMDFKDILQLSEIYKKYGFSLYCIADNFREKQKGLVFYFHPTEDEE